jgi:hypothetical protein
VPAVRGDHVPQGRLSRAWDRSSRSRPVPVSRPSPTSGASRPSPRTTRPG